MTTTTKKSTNTKARNEVKRREFSERRVTSGNSTIVDTSCDSVEQHDKSEHWYIANQERTPMEVWRQYSAWSEVSPNEMRISTEKSPMIIM